MTVLRTAGLIAGIVLGVILVFVVVSGDEKQEYLDKLGDPDTQQEAVIGLYVIKEDIVPFLAEELEKDGHSETARIGIVRVLAKKYGSGSDPRIQEVFRKAVSEMPSAVRKEIYRTAASLQCIEMMDIVIRGLEEQAPDIHKAILTHFDFTDEIRKDVSLKDRLIDRMAVLQKSPEPVVAETAGAFLGEEIQNRVREAGESAADFNFSRAEEILLNAKKLSPENPLINYALGKFYLVRKKNTEKGSALLSRYGFLYRVRATDTPPEIDGNMNERLWKNSTPLKGFYKIISRSHIYRPADTKIEAYMRYDREHLYLAAAGYADYIRLAGNADRRDGPVWRDDCCEMYFDADLDENTYYQIVINYKGVVRDLKAAAQGRRRRRRRHNFSWNAPLSCSTKLKRGEYWSLEVRFPWETFRMDGPPRPGDVWGFNIAWSKQMKPAEYAQWCPTYGNAHDPRFFGLIVFE